MGLEAYRKFVLRFKITEFTNAFSEFTEEQMKIMLQCLYFELTPERLLEMKEEHPNLSSEFILRNKETFFAHLSDYALSVSEVEALINSPDMRENEKLSINNQNAGYKYADIKNSSGNQNDANYS